MLDILTIVHGFADIQTAARIRRTCRRLGSLIPHPKLYNRSPPKREVYRVGGKLHRLDGPAVVCIGHSVYWYREDLAHREYHPQYIHRDLIAYGVDDKIHREVGPSIIRGKYGEWYMRGRRHRKTGPANSYEDSWYTLDKLHRLDGPARRQKYAIRGNLHRISSPMYGNCWIVEDEIIRE